jgi:phosphoribosylanthranilate isomerase
VTASAAGVRDLAIVKICGITRVDDAHQAIGCGANALGFVFWPRSPRFIDPFRARAIVKTLPPFVTVVGVFVDQSPAEINGIAALVPLHAVQLHGSEAPPTANAIRVTVLKALSGPDADASADHWETRVTLLVDAHDPERRGGTGRKADWSTAARIAARRPIILAGGLTPDNVAAAIGAVQPFGIDLSSGVESAPGIKDPVRLRALFDVVRASPCRRADEAALGSKRQS